MTKAVVLMAVLVAVLSAAACGGSGTQSSSDSGLKTLQGDEFRLAEKRGEVVALYFMAGY
ncbi:MAG: hypothetical protein M3N18_05835 [Actinomycetota bacterium]|nr:hypothetical protein [Actinomycetota bacterium]